MNKTVERTLGAIFLAATIIFIFALLTNHTFQSWAFARHHNLWSWYIRPLMIIPIIFFAFKRSFAGITAAIFTLFTSMVWFPEPVETNERVQGFLAYEMAYLNSDWTLLKILFSLSVIAFFCLVIAAA